MKNIARFKELQFAWNIAEIMSEYEIKLLKTRRDLLRVAQNNPQGLSSTINKVVGEYTAESQTVAIATLNEIKPLIDKEFERIDTQAKKSVDSRVKPTEIKKTSTLALNTATVMIISQLAKGLYQASDNGRKQLLYIANQDKDIDEVQKLFYRGLTADNRELASYGEFATRQATRDLRLQSEGERAGEYGMHYTLISAHPSSCPLCIPWQAEVLIDDVFAGGKADGKYELLSTAIDEGLYHFNCRHERTVFILGKDNPKLYDKYLTPEDKRLKETESKEVSKRYAVEQQQRYNERMIRDWKRREAMAISKEQEILSRNKVKEWQANQRALQKIAERENVTFYRQYLREDVKGKTQPLMRKEMIKRING